MKRVLTGQSTRRFKILLTAVLVAAFAFGSASFATTANAANTCQAHSVDGFRFGVCVNRLQTTGSARAELYIDTVNQNVLKGCTIELELWWEDHIGPALTDNSVPCTPPAKGGPQTGELWGVACGGEKAYVHADAYLHAANAGFRVGPSATVVLDPGC